MNDVRNIKDKMFGCLYGHAIGDALGLGSEFMNKEGRRKPSYDNVSERGFIHRYGTRLELLFLSCQSIG